MSELGHGYGSEFQLLRFLGRHRHLLERAIAHILAVDEVPGVERIDWHDFPFSAISRKKIKDQEFKGLDFLDKTIWSRWQKYWPDPRAGTTDRNGIHTWDAVAKLFSPMMLPEGEWLLVEAKSHESELVTSPSCGAGGDSLNTIIAALKETFLAMGGDELAWRKAEKHWIGPGFYQIANRLAALHFLRNILKMPAHLLFIYFLRDPYTGKNCPDTPAKWKRILGKSYKLVDFPENYKLKQYVHYLCLDTVNGEFHPLNFSAVTGEE
jgi:hypothetical protein